MKIAESSIVMSSSRLYTENYEKSERLKYWVGDQEPSDSGNGQNSNRTVLTSSEQQGYKLEISEWAKSMISDLKTGEVSEIEEQDLATTKEELKIQMIEKFIETLTGKKIKLKVPQKLEIKENDCPEIQVQNPAQQGQPRRAGWGLRYDFHERYQESEITKFNADGIIKTADGKEIKISLDVSMSREFMSQTDIHAVAGDAKIDPLVINYSGHSANITQTKYSFDIDSNGDAEQISFAGEGSGFLALDKNGDGKINDGSELFGPQSGNGFEDLAQYDGDNNGWIDENDSIYDKLRIWAKDESGKDYLFALGEKGIGAIYLGNVGTQFDITDSQNNSNGEVVRTGIFLRENGTAGTIQHIDLTI